MTLSLITLVLLAVTLFASTNVDDLLVLVSFFAHPEFRPQAVVAGQYAGIAILFSVSVACSLLKTVITPHYLGLLGLAPVLIGVIKLLALRHRHAEDSGHPHVGRIGGSTKQAAQVAAVTIANGGDNLGVYIPSFAVRGESEIACIAAVFLAMIAVWCGAAYTLVNRPKLGKPIRRYGRMIAPLVLMALGFGILYKAGTLGWLLSI